MAKSTKRTKDGVPKKTRHSGKVKFEIYGEEVIEKKVRPSGASGRVYLPSDWVDRHVKVVRID
jgi:putative transposon-encoded protein